MASQVSALYHRWASRCYSNAAILEQEAAVMALGGTASLSRVEAVVRDSIQSYIELGEPSREDLRRMASWGLRFAESVGEFIDAAGLPSDHTLRQLQDELADHAEAIAESIDEGLVAAHRDAMAEQQRGELIPLDEIEAH
ncbi:MAG: hypothetical protein ACREMY_15910 [bacterium]